MWELISFASGKTRKLCLELLINGPKKPIVIVKKSNIHMSHISRALRELEEKGLIECLTPNLTKNRIYGITQMGKEVFNKIKEIEEK